MSNKTRISRRRFLQGSAGAGASLVLGVYLGGCTNASAVAPTAPSAPPAPTSANAPPAPTPAPTAAPTPAPTGPAFAPSAWLEIDTNGIVTISIAKPDMGQGVRTSLAMLVAEELEVDWANVRVRQAPADRARYGNQLAAGSTSIRQLYQPLRTAGAAAREMLVAAAAQSLQVEPASLRAERGVVRHDASGRSVSYAELVPTAATLPAPQGSIALKQPGDFRLIGTPTPRVDNPQVVDGSAIYGLDVRLPGMRYAVVARPPVIGGALAGYDDKQARVVPGVLDVVQIESGVAVVAENTWAALKGREALQITWNDGPYAQLDSAAISAQLRERVGEPRQFPNAAQVIEAAYDLPYLAHAPMEPMNCVADVRAGSCEIWVGTQSPGGVQQTVAGMLRLPTEAVTVNVTLLGGGFGRRADTDFVVEAVQVSRAISAPVKLVWSRDDDMQHGAFRPTSHHRLRGGLDANGQIIGWSHRVAMPGRAGSADLPYNIAVAFDVVNVTQPIPTWFWRSVFSSQSGFVNESFLDELATAAGADPYEMRRRLAASPRLRAGLELAASKAGWGAPLPAGQGRGIAAHEEYGSFIAVVAEVAVAETGAVRVQRVVCAVDCGIVINPQSVEAQIQGAVADGVATALKAEITIAGGRVQQRSFADFEWLRINEMPAVEVYLIPSRESPGGIGELGYPPTPPAIANAIFAATGKRVRKLPIRAEDLV